MTYAQRFREIMNPELNRMEDEVISEKFRNILGDKHPFEILETKDVHCSVDVKCNDISRKYHEECNNYIHLLEEFEQKLYNGLEPHNLIKQLEILNSRVNECRQGRITYMIRCCRNLENNNIIAGDIGHIAYIVKLNELQSHINDIIKRQKNIIINERKQKKDLEKKIKKEESERLTQLRLEEIERQTQLRLEENQRQTQLKLEQERLQAIQKAKIKEEEAEAAKKEKERIAQIEYQLKRERIEQAVREAREKQKIDKKTRTEEREEQFLDLISSIKFDISNFLITDKKKNTKKDNKEQEKEFFEKRKQILENLIKLLIGFYKNKQALNKEQIVSIFWESTLVDEEFCEYASEKLHPFYKF